MPVGHDRVHPRRFVQQSEQHLSHPCASGSACRISGMMTSSRDSVCQLARALTAAGIIAACVGPVGAQVPQVSPLLPGCPAGRTPLVDTTQVLVVLEPAKVFLDSAYTDAQRLQISFYADAIARHFVPPPTLGDIPTLVDLPAYYADGEDDGSRSVLGGRLVLIVKRNGRVTLAWEYFPLATPLAQAVVRAAQVADSAGDFDGIMRPEDKRTDDTLAIDVRSRLEGDAAQFPLMRARVSGYRGETLAMVSKAGRLEYPSSAGRARVGTRGEVRFVVGTDGRAVAAYTQVTRAGWRDFVLPMTKAIAGTEFVPATSGGCKVPALARQRFSFIIP